LTVHLVVPTGVFDDARMADLSRALHDRFGIEHATVQIERGTDGGCPAGTNCEPAATGGKTNGPT
jgi:cobalt-zinc-cadmium efflux system protein